MDSDSDLASVARETFEYGVIMWAGRKYGEWVRAWSNPHPLDSRGLVQLPAEIYKAFQARPPGQRLGRDQAEALGYPRVPGERELARVRRQLHDALGRSDWERAHDLDAQLRDLETRVAAMRLSALRPNSAIG